MPVLFDPQLTVSYDEVLKKHEVSVRFVRKDEVYLAMHKAFSADLEGKIRQALIDMGWTPPPSPSHDHSPSNAGEGNC